MKIIIVKQGSTVPYAEFEAESPPRRGELVATEDPGGFSIRVAQVLWKIDAGRLSHVEVFPE